MFLQFDSSDVRNLLLRVAIRLPCFAECDLAGYRLFLPSRIASFARSRSLLAETPSPRVLSPRFTVLRAPVESLLPYWHRKRALPSGLTFAKNPLTEPLQWSRMMASVPL